MKLKNPLQPYKPTPSNPWDSRKVGHLYRRAGFGATHAEIDAGLADGHEKTLERILTGKPETEDFTRTSDFMASAKSMPPGAPLARLSAWWLDRMLKTAHPLREKFTLFWHNHFATSNAKVESTGLMQRQNELLRRDALGDFPTMLSEMSCDAESSRT